MKCLAIITAFVLLLPGLVAGQQGPDLQAFAAFREANIETAGGTPLNSRVAAMFALPENVRIVEAATMRLPQRSLILAFSIDTADIFFMDSQSGPTGRVVTVFHAEHPSLTFRAAASGATYDELQRLPSDLAGRAFDDVIKVWDRYLHKMLSQ